MGQPLHISIGPPAGPIDICSAMNSVADVAVIRQNHCNVVTHNTPNKACRVSKNNVIGHLVLELKIPDLEIYVHIK